VLLRNRFQPGGNDSPLICGCSHKFLGGNKMAWTSVHTVLGEMENGTKVVMTDVVPDSDAATLIRVAPLKTIYSYFGGIKDVGTTPRTVSFAQGANLLNTITVTPSGDMSGGVIGILSFGV
jgi:hypothetical protein